MIQRFMDIMRSACHNVPDWPSKLSKLKQLCGFFRCQGWRKVIIERGAGHYDNLPVLLKKFTAKFLKWRYETLFECFTQLAALRDLCQRVLYVHLRSFFPSFKDAGLLDAIISHCGNSELWVFISTFAMHVFTPLEKTRRWGLLCACHEEERRANPRKKIKCVMNSRRLHQARRRLKDLKDMLTETGRHVNFILCENVAWVAQSLSFICRRLAVDLSYKTSHYGLVPWLVSEADDPEVAGQCAVQLRDGNVASFSPLELSYREKLLGDLEASAIRWDSPYPPTPSK